MTKRQKIDAAREARLWVGQIVVPVVCSTALLLSNPETRTKAKATFDKGVAKVKSLFKKEEPK